MALLLNIRKKDFKIEHQYIRENIFLFKYEHKFYFFGLERSENNNKMKCVFILTFTARHMCLLNFMQSRLSFSVT